MDYEDHAEMIDHRIADSWSRVYEKISREFFGVSLEMAILEEIEWLRS